MTVTAVPIAGSEYGMNYASIPAGRSQTRLRQRAVSSESEIAFTEAFECLAVRASEVRVQ